MFFCFHGTGDCLVKERKLLETKIKGEGELDTALDTDVYAEFFKRPSSLRKGNSMEKSRIIVSHYGHKGKKRYTLFIKERLGISKVSCLPRVICEFNASPVKTQQANS